MTQSTIRGLLFDKDGTLFDFQATWGAVVDETLSRLAKTAAMADAMAADIGFERGSRRFLPGSPVVAGSLGEIAGILATHRPDLAQREIERTAIACADEATANGDLAPAVPDLAGFLAGLAANGYTLGVATHDTEAAARYQLETVGALEVFDFVAGYDSGHGLKPGPGMLLAFAKATGLAPAQIAMIGDSVHDLRVAPAAGAALGVGVLTGPATAEDLADDADHILSSIADLPSLLAGLAT